MAYEETIMDGSEQEMPESPQPEGKGSFYLPADFPGADALKAGDTVTLHVVGKDEDGDIEVSSTAPAAAEEPGFAAGLRTEMED